MSWFRRSVESMQAYVPGEQPPAGARVIKLNTNENPYPPSPEVARAIAAELQGSGERLRLYSDPLARSLREAAAQLYGLKFEQVLHGNGSDELLALLVRALVEPGETIAYPYPTYVLYETLAHGQGARIQTVDFPSDYSLPRGLFGSDAKIVFIASPNSPSATSHGVESLARLARSLGNGVLVVDEAYADFAEGHALELLRSEPNVAILRTFSKSYSLAGMRLGLLLANETVITQIAKLKDSYNLDRLAIAAGTAALGDQAWMRTNVERIQRTRTRLTAALQRLGLEVLPSQANFVFARLRDAHQAQAAYQTLKGQGILVRYFKLRLLDDGLRITVGTDAEVDLLLEALGRIVRGN